MKKLRIPKTQMINPKSKHTIVEETSGEESGGDKSNVDSDTSSNYLAFTIFKLLH